MKFEHVTAAQLYEAGYALVETTLTIKTVIFIDVRANFVQHKETKKLQLITPKLPVKYGGYAKYDGFC